MAVSFFTCWLVLSKDNLDPCNARGLIIDTMLSPMSLCSWRKDKVGTDKSLLHNSRGINSWLH